MPLDETHGTELWPDGEAVFAYRGPSYAETRRHVEASFRKIEGKFLISRQIARLRGFSAAIRLEIPTAADLLDEIIDGLVEELAK